MKGSYEERVEANYRGLRLRQVTRRLYFHFKVILEPTGLFGCTHQHQPPRNEETSDIMRQKVQFTEKQPSS